MNVTPNPHRLSHTPALQPHFSSLTRQIEAENNAMELQLQRQVADQQQLVQQQAALMEKVTKPLLEMGERNYTGLQLLQLVNENSGFQLSDNIDLKLLFGTGIVMTGGLLCLLLPTIMPALLKDIFGKQVSKQTLVEMLDPTVERKYKDTIQKALKQLEELGLLKPTCNAEHLALTPKGKALLTFVKQ